MTKNITASFHRAPKIFLKSDFYTCTLGEQWQIKKKKLKLGHYEFWKCYIQGAPRKKQYLCFFRGAPKILRINVFYTYTLGK